MTRLTALSHFAAVARTASFTLAAKEVHASQSVVSRSVLRLEDEVIGLIEDFADAGKTIAAICHAPWLLIEADIVDGRAVTGWPSIHTDLENAGAQVFDEEVIVDGNLITSRKPDDIPAFARALIEALQDQPETV